MTKSVTFRWRDHLDVHPAAELFPLMSEAELQELAEDIKKNGLSAPIVLWHPDGDGKPSLIDGRNRLDALAPLGLLVFDENGRLVRLAFKKRQNDCHPITFADQSCDPYALALSLNVHRRHLTNEQKRELIGKVLKAKPEASNVAIAKAVKADDKTVASVRRELEANSEIPNKPDRVEASGRRARGRKPATKPPGVKKTPEAASKRSTGNDVDTQASAEERMATPIPEVEEATPPPFVRPGLNFSANRWMGWFRNNFAAAAMGVPADGWSRQKGDEACELVNQLADELVAKIRAMHGSGDVAEKRVHALH
jgi:ParB-like chromosome segregation protein Spo0J